MGLLAPMGPQDWHPAPHQIVDRCKMLVDMIEKRTGNRAAAVKLAFQFTYAEKDVHSLLVGCTEVSQLIETLEWAKEPLGDADLGLLDEAEEILAPIKNKMWVEEGSEENIAIASGGFWAKQRAPTQMIAGVGSSYSLPENAVGKDGAMSFEDLVPTKK